MIGRVVVCGDVNRKDPLAAFASDVFDESIGRGRARHKATRSADNPVRPSAEGNVRSMDHVDGFLGDGIEGGDGL